MAIYCPQCGKELPDDAGFCMKCGKPLKGAPHSPAQTEPEWEYCSLEATGSYYDGYILAKAVGPKGTYIAAKSQRKIGYFASDSKREAIINEFINSLVASGWEPQPKGSGASFTGYRFRRRIS